MLIVVDELEEPLQIDWEFTGHSLPFGHEGAQLIQPLHLRGAAMRSGQDVTIQGFFTTTLELICGRCLKPFSLPVNQRLDLFYEPLNAQAEESRELSYNDMDISYYKGEAIDVNQMLVEQLELLVPMKPICAPDCKGLCDVCGADLNTETCRCMREVVDERLQSLQRLKQRLKPE